MPSAEPTRLGAQGPTGHRRRHLLAGLLCVLLGGSGAARGEDCASFEIVGDRIPAPLEGIVGDVHRGPEVALAADRGDCTICHRMPLPGRQFHGTVGPALDRVGARLDVAQLRLRIAAPKRLHPNTLMPAYCTTTNRHRVGLGFVGRPILSAAEIEDLVAWLATLDGTAAAPPSQASDADAQVDLEATR